MAESNDEQDYQDAREGEMDQQEEGEIPEREETAAGRKVLGSGKLIGQIQMGVRTALIPIGKPVDAENTRDKITRMLQLFLARGSQAAQDTLAAMENQKMNIDVDIRFEGHSDTVRRAVQISHDNPNVMYALDEWQQSNEVVLLGGVTLIFREHTVAASQAASEKGEDHDEATKRNPSVIIQMAGFGIISDENLDEAGQQLEDLLGCVCPTVMRGNEFDKTTGEPLPGPWMHTRPPPPLKYPRCCCRKIR